MKILIIATNRERNPIPAAPIGAMYIAAAASEVGYDVEMLDLMFEPNTERAIKKNLSYNYDVIGFSIRNLDTCSYANPYCYDDDILKIVNCVRNYSNAVMIAGGTGYSIEPYNWLKLLNIPYGIVGPGETAFVSCIKAIEQGNDLQKIPGLIMLKDIDKVQCRCDKALLVDMPAVEAANSTLIPAHHLCNYSKYLSRGGCVTIQSKRGCSFNCIYCVYNQLEGSSYQLRPIDVIADEMEQVARNYRNSCFYFVDSVFNYPSEHCKELCRKIIDNGIRTRWMAYCNPVEFDDELAKLMNDAGCIGIEFGLDSVTEKMLVNMQKPFTQKQIECALQAAANNDIPFAIHLLFGGPIEATEDIQQTQDFLDTCAPANAVFASLGLRIYHSTPLEKIAIQQGVIKRDANLFYPEYYMSPEFGDDPVATLDEIASQRYQWTTATDWYSTPMRLLQKLINLTGQRPQWRDAGNYGRYIRRKKKGAQPSMDGYDKTCLR